MDDVGIEVGDEVGLDVGGVEVVVDKAWVDAVGVEVVGNEGLGYLWRGISNR